MSNSTKGGGGGGGGGPPASKRPRQLETTIAAAAAAAASGAVQQGPPVFLQLLDLPTLFQVMVSFLNASERLHLAETCRGARDQVDVHCARVLDVITGTDNCNVDGTFDARIRNQSNIRTARTKPVELPPRYLLSAAVGKEPLYKIMLDVADGDGHTVFDVVLSPSQGRAAIDLGSNIYVYDLKTREKLATLFHEDLGDHAIIFLDNSHILSHSPEKILLWTQGHKNGDWSSSVFFQKHRERVDGKGIMDFFRPDQHKILVATVIVQSQNDGSTNQTRIAFDSLDVNDRPGSEPTTFVMDTQNDGFTEIDHLQIAGILDQKWLLFVVIEWSNMKSPSGLYVYDIEKKRMVQFLKDCGPSFCFVKQAPTCPTTFYATKKNENDLWCVVVLDFDVRSGRVTERSHLPLDGTRVFAVSKSHIVVSKDSFRDSTCRMRVYNLETGKPELWIPYRRFEGCVAATVAAPNLIGNRNELLVVAGVVDGISAFCISEPQL